MKQALMSNNGLFHLLRIHLYRTKQQPLNHKSRRCWTLAEQSYKRCSLVSSSYMLAWRNAIITFFMPFDPAPCDKKSFRTPARPPLFGEAARSGHETKRGR